MSILSELSQLKSITQEEQERGTEKLRESGIEYDDETIEGVIDKMGGKKYTAGNGIEISDENEISAKIGEGLEFGSDGAITALPNIENAVIISEADARYLLHEYTEIKYTAGNRIGYAGPFNQIVVQGYLLSKYDQSYIKSDYASEAELPDVAYYTSYNFANKSLHTNYQGISAVTELGTEPTAFTSAYTTYQIYVIRATGDKIAIANNNAYEGKFGITLLWENIYPPGYVYNNETYEYGAVGCQLCYKIKTSTSYAFQRHAYGSFLLPFASEAEYHAAVGLTYEPNILTEVQETVTEV